MAFSRLIQHEKSDLAQRTNLIGDKKLPIRMGCRGENEGKFWDLTSLKPFPLRDWISDLISFTSDL